MKLKNSYFYTLRQEAKDEESVSGNLLTRSGMIKKSSSGIYTYLPLGYKIVKNVEKIIKEEMENINAGELFIPTLIQEGFSLLEENNSNDTFILTDRFDKHYSLATNHERIFMEAVLSRVNSYKDIPFMLYQIQTKFKDDERPRNGLIRTREFLTKNAYSFDGSEKGMDQSYDAVYNAYKKIFARLGISYCTVTSDKSAGSGLVSEEFQALTDLGEDTLVICEKCGYSSNANAAKGKTISEENGEEIKVRELIKTPEASTIDEVSKFLGEDPARFVKTLIYKIDDKLYAVLVKGTREVNEYKLTKLLNAKNVCLASVDEVLEVTGANIGFVGPIGLTIPVILDSEIMNMTNFIVGANKTNYHYKNVNLEDFNYLFVDDVRVITDDDVCFVCGNKLTFKKGVEIGNTVKLGCKKALDFGLNFTDQNNDLKPIWMGNYNIGISRCIATIVEQNHDDKGIIWPYEVAPFKVAIVILNMEDKAQVDAANYLYNELKVTGISTLLDDRIERAGVKFNDMDLIGIPIRITVGNKIADQIVEIKLRKEDTFEEISLYDALSKVEDIIENI